MAADGGPLRPAWQRPEPARLWIAWAVRGWPSAAGWWTDLAAARLCFRPGRGGGRLPAIVASGLDDLLYLPPVASERRGDRDRLAASLAAAGTPVLVQLEPGERLSGPGLVAVFDLLGPLLAGDLDRLGELPAGSTAVWPLIAGLSDRPASWEEGCRRLAAAGVDCVQATAPEVEPDLGSRLARERGDEVFDALFHRPSPGERAFCLCARRHGLEVFMPRPASGRTPRRVRNRRLAAALALAGELWLRLGRPVAAGQALLRAARGAEQTRHDLTALVRERNLGVMDWLEEASAELIVEMATAGRSSLLTELRAAYLDPETETTTENHPTRNESDGDE